MWILIEVAAIAVIILGRLYLGWFGFAITLVIFVAVTLPNLSRRLSRSRLTARAFQDFAYVDVKCPHCTVGLQTLHNKTDTQPGGWGPIPEHVRIAQKSSNIFHPRQANIRNCPQCAGKGFRPTKVVRGETMREPIVWPPRDGSLMSDEPVYAEKPELEE